MFSYSFKIFKTMPSIDLILKIPFIIKIYLIKIAHILKLEFNT